LRAHVTFSNEGYLVVGVVRDSKHKQPEITDKRLVPPSRCELLLVRSFSVFGKNSRMGGSRSRTAVPRTLRDGRMVEAPTIGTKMLPSRDHGHLIDGSLSLDGFRRGWMATMAASAKPGSRRAFWQLRSWFGRRRD
jgi:hypothetical protein